MTIEEKILSELRLEIKKAGGKTELAKRRSLAYSIVNRFDNGECKIHNMTVGTLRKLFPGIELVFPADVKKTSKEADAGLRIEYEKYISDLQKAKQELEKDRQLFELEKENWRLKREIEEIGKNEGVPDLLRR